MKKFNLSSITSQYRAHLVLSTYRRWFKRNEKVIDVGCGTGVVTSLLKKEFELKIIGCDIKNYLVYDIPFVEIKNGKLPFPNRSYDVILLIDVLHHIEKPEQEQIIAESLRVAKKVFIFEFEPTLSGKIADIVLNKIHYGDLHVPFTFRYAEDWKQLFASLPAKFDFVKLKKPFWYPFSHIAFKVSKK